MPQLDELELADLIAESVKAACGPLVLRLRALERNGIAVKNIDAQSGEHLTAVNERISAIEAKAAELPRHGKDGAPGRDGLGIADALITKEGHLMLTLSDGMTRQIGKVVGESGRDGANGKDGSSFTTGIGAPVAFGGQSGDVYVDAKTGDVYQWR